MTSTIKPTLSEFPSQTIASAAKKTGLSETTIHRKIATGELRAYKVGGRRIRIADSDLLALYAPIPAYGVSHD